MCGNKHIMWLEVLAWALGVATSPAVRASHLRGAIMAEYDTARRKVEHKNHFTTYFAPDLLFSTHGTLIRICSSSTNSLPSRVCVDVLQGVEMRLAAPKSKQK